MMNFQLLFVLVNFLYIVSAYDAINSDLLPTSDVCGISRKAKTPDNQIVVADLDEFPWLALLEYETEGANGFLCGGVLINNRYVLTGAVCAKGRHGSTKLTSVRLGEFNTETSLDCVEIRGTEAETCAPEVLDVPVSEIIIHEDYNSKTHLNDIALLRLQTSVVFNRYLKPICLMTSDNLLNKNYTGTHMIVSGWSKTPDSDDTDDRSNKLKLSVPVTSNEYCKSIYEPINVTIASSQMCAGGVKEKDLCTGAGGTSLMTKQEDDGKSNWYAAGTMSFGHIKCGTANWPSVYTRVSEYVPWIISKLQD